MAGIKRSEFTEAMKQDMYSYFWESYPQVPSVWESLFEVVPSNHAYEKFTSAIGLGELLEKPEGEALQSDSPMESYTIVCKNRSFGRKVPFSYESVQDSAKGNLLQSTVSTWGDALVRTKEIFYASFFNQGAMTAGHDVFNNTITGVVDDTTAGVIYDGQPWFDTAHPDKVGNTYSNYEAAEGLTHTNLMDQYLTYTTTNNRDERGSVVSMYPDVLLIHPALRFTAEVILKTTTIPGGAAVWVPDVNVMYNILAPQEWAYLTDLDGWFMGKRKMGLMATARETVSLDFWQDEETLDYFARIFTRFGGAITNWRYWRGSNIASS